MAIPVQVVRSIDSFCDNEEYQYAEYTEIYGHDYRSLPARSADLMNKKNLNNPESNYDWLISWS